MKQMEQALPSPGQGTSCSSYGAWGAPLEQSCLQRCPEVFILILGRKQRGSKTSYRSSLSLGSSSHGMWAKPATKLSS